jgi:hypothetical protein
MKKYNLSFSPESYKYIARLSAIDKARILEKINKLPDGDTKKMNGEKDPSYRLRV